MGQKIPKLKELSLSLSPSLSFGDGTETELWSKFKQFSPKQAIWQS